MSRFDELEDLAAIQQRPRWPGALLLLGLLGGLLYFLWGLAHPISPLKVLVMVEMNGPWLEGSEPAARLTDEINAQLAEMGLEPVLPGTTGALPLLKAGGDPGEIADALGARFWVTGALALDVEEIEIGDGYAQGHYHGEITIQGHDRAPESGRVEGWSGSRRRAKAERLAAQGAATDAISVLAPYLLHDEPLEALTKAEPEAYTQVAGLRAFMDLRGQALRTRAKALEARRARWKKRYPGLEIHGEGDEADGICGVSRRGLLFKSAGIEVVPEVGASKLKYRYAREAASWWTDKAERVWRGHNLRGWPYPAREADVIGLSESLYGKGDTLVVLREGERLEIERDEDRRFSAIKPSPSGTRIAFYEQACRRCDMELVIWDIAGEKALGRRDGEPIHNFDWWDDDRLLFLEDTTELPATAPTSQPVEAAEGAEGAEPAPTRASSGGLWAWRGVEPPQLIAVSAESGQWRMFSTDGARAALTTYDDEGPALTVVTLADGQATRYGLPSSPKHPHIQGEEVVFGIYRGRSHEIAHLKLGQPEPTILTNDNLEQRHAHLYEGRVYFEVLERDPSFPRRDTQTLASLPVPR